MSKRVAIIIAAAAFLVGVVAGGWSVGAFYNRLTSRLLIGSLTSDAITTVDDLRRLRAGDATNVVELLEIKLDGDLIGLDTFLADPREFTRDPLYVKSLQKVRDYRTEFPHKTDSPDVDRGVAEAFTLLDAQTNR